MSKTITCAMCGSPVDDADTVHMPNGQMCIDPCYLWLEKMIEEAESDTEDEDDDELFWDDDADNEDDTFEDDPDSSI